ncbi:MAG TPA: heparin lyase I family protein [Solirubrobacterales bacterium]|jgi:hypothetical protein|nr:heparin lyase I family protein [Solirubrobacterales bacterium]
MTPSACWPVIAPTFNGRHIAEYFLNQSVAGHITEVPDPGGSGLTVLRFEVLNTDVFPLTPTADPRAQLLSPHLLTAGSEWWYKGAFWLPEGFPTSGLEWCQFVQFFGAPFEGSSPWLLKSQESPGVLMWQRRADYAFDQPWVGPPISSLIGKWTDFLVHLKFAEAGWVEMWINGNPITFFNPATSYNPNKEAETQKLLMRTNDPGVNDAGPNSVILQLYHKLNVPKTPVIVYHKPLQIGRTRGSVGG